MGQTLRRTGPYSRSAQLAKPRRRTRESRFLLQIREDLTKHLGGAPNIAQALMIDRIAMTLLRIELMDREALMSDNARRDHGEAVSGLSGVGEHRWAPVAQSWPR
jgi:hypothetical protein